MKRRTFFSTLGATIGTSIPAFSIVSRHVLGGKNYIAPSDKLNVAAIGAGGKAWQNLNRTFQKGEANIVSLCDVDDRMAKQSREAWPDASYYRDFRQMLDKEDKNIDGVIVVVQIICMRSMP